MKIKVHISGTLLILFVFIAQCVTGLWQSKVLNTPAPLAVEDWVSQMIAFNYFKSYFEYVPYLLLMLIVVFRFWPRLLKTINFDLFDVLLIIVYLFSCLITTLDYKLNDNTRDSNLDIQAFAIITLIIIGLKGLFKLFEDWKR